MKKQSKEEENEKGRFWMYDPKTPRQSIQPGITFEQMPPPTEEESEAMTKLIMATYGMKGTNPHTGGT